MILRRLLITRNKNIKFRTTTVLQIPIEDSRNRNDSQREREREGESWKREKLRAPSLNQQPHPNHESYQSSIANFHILPSSACSNPASIPDSFDHWRKGQEDCSLAGNRIPVASSISGCAARALVSSPPESRGEFGSVAWFGGGWGGTWRVIGGVRARFNPRRKFSRAMSSEIDSRPQLPDKSDINVESHGLV